MGRAHTILVVDDNRIMRKLMRVTLEGAGFQVIESPDATSALASMAAEAPDLVLQDLVLPDMDGRELGRRLRALSGAERVPIVALTGLESQAEQVQREGDVFNELLIKPIAPTLLLERVRSYLTPSAPVPSVQPRNSDHSRATRPHRPASRGPLHAMPATHAPDRESPRATVRLPAAGVGQAPPGPTQVAQLRDSEHSRATRPHLQPARAEQPGPAWAPPTRNNEHGRSTVPHRPNVLDEETARLRREFEQGETRQADLARRCALQAASVALVRRLPEVLGRTPDMDSALEQALYVVLEMGGGSAGAIYLENEPGAFELSACIGVSPGAARGSDHHELLQQVRDGSTPVDLARSPAGQRALQSLGAWSGIAIPVVVGGTCLGQLLLGLRTPDSYDAERIELASVAATFIAQWIALAQALQCLERSEARVRTLTDELTQRSAAPPPKPLTRTAEQGSRRKRRTRKGAVRA